MFRRLRWLIVGALGTVLVMVVPGALAAPASRSQTFSGQMIRHVLAVTSDGFNDTDQGRFQDLPGASVTFTVPASTAGLVTAGFSAETSFPVGGSAYGTVRILVDGVEMAPKTGLEFHFTRPGTEGITGIESHSMERVLGPIAAGVHNVRVQFAACCRSSGVFEVRDWTLVVEVAQT